MGIRETSTSGVNAAKTRGSMVNGSQCLPCLLLVDFLGGFSPGHSPLGSVKSATDPVVSSEATPVADAALVSPGAPAADTTAPDTGEEGMHPSPFSDRGGPSVDQGMLIRPDTTVDPEILEVLTPDSIDPEMVLPPRRHSGRMGGPARRFPESYPETDTLGTIDTGSR